MVVTDALGRRQVITASYIRDAELLREGVNQFSYEMGVQRYYYGTRSNAYGGFLSDFTQRRGVTNRLTVEGRLEFQPGAETIGGGAVYAIHGLGTVAGGVAGSVSTGYAWGHLVYGQINQNRRAFGFGATMQRASEDFRQVGLAPQQRADKMVLQGQVSKALGRRGTFAVGYLRRDGRTNPDARAVTASFNLRLGRAIFTVGGTYSLLHDHQVGLDAALVVPLGERKLAVASADMNGTVKTTSLEASQQLPLGPGWGYRVKTTQLDQEVNDGGLYYQNMLGSYGVEVGDTGGDLSWRLSERGSLVYLHGHTMLAPWLNDSFGVIDAGGIKGVPVYVNNLLLAKTGSKGMALVPWMVPYIENLVRIDDSTLPLDVSLEGGERRIVPMPRSGVFLKYKPVSMGGATLVLMATKDLPVPVGAQVSINGGATRYTVALRGEVFIEEMVYPAAVDARWGKNGTCQIRIEHPPEQALVPKIGPLLCDARKIDW